VVVTCLIGTFILAYRLKPTRFILATLSFLISIWFLMAAALSAVIRSHYELEHLFLPWPWLRALMIGLSGTFWLRECWRRHIWQEIGNGKATDPDPEDEFDSLSPGGR